MNLGGPPVYLPRDLLIGTLGSMYSYDRRANLRTAAKMDLHDKWADIVRRHRDAQQKEFKALLHESAKYLYSVGLILDEKQSYIDVSDGGSDGPRFEGNLIVSEAPENTFKVEKPAMIAKWVAEALDVHGAARLVSDGPAKRQIDDLPVGTWSVDISSY